MVLVAGMSNIPTAACRRSSPNFAARSRSCRDSISRCWPNGWPMTSELFPKLLVWSTRNCVRRYCMLLNWKAWPANFLEKLSWTKPTPSDGARAAWARGVAGKSIASGLLEQDSRGYTKEVGHCVVRHPEPHQQDRRGLVIC